MTRPQINRSLAIVALFLSATVALAGPSIDRKISKADKRAVELDRARAVEGQFLLRTPDIDAAVAESNLTVVGLQPSPSGDVWLVEAPEGSKSSEIIEQLLANGLAKGAETVELAGLPALTLNGTETSELGEELAFSGTLDEPCLNAYMPGAWSGFTGQAATEKIQLSEARQYGGCGSGMVVAVIDTEVDTSHPHLQDAVVSGYDFVTDMPFGLGSGGAHADLDVRTLAILESSETAVLAGDNHLVGLTNGVVVLGQSDLAAETDLGELPAYYGHGTMTAGLVRMIAPGAMIMPLVAFSDEGTGHPFHIISAIYYAVDHGADVINMSFSMEEYSLELGLALEYARSHGVIPVAATGNSGQHRYSFPASFTATIGVASSTWGDQLSDFTNYGIPTGDLTAPGEELVTLYPGGGYAVGWGTSFSTPLTAGTVALIRGMHAGHGPGSHKHTRLDLLKGTIYKPYLWNYIWSSGRLNAFGAVLYSLGYL